MSDMFGANLEQLDQLQRRFTEENEAVRQLQSRIYRHSWVDCLDRPRGRAIPYRVERRVRPRPQPTGRGLGGERQRGGQPA